MINKKEILSYTGLILIVLGLLVLFMYFVYHFVDLTVQQIYTLIESAVC